MKLISVKVEGFRNIEEDKLILGNEMTSLVSENGYGKSNLIQAVEFAISFMLAVPADKYTMMGLKRCVPLNIKTENRDFKASFVFETDFRGDAYRVIYEFSFVWIKNSGGRKIKSEELKIRKSKNTGKYIQIIKRDTQNQDGCTTCRTSPKGRCDSIIKIEDNELIINKLLNFDDLYYIPLIKDLNCLSMCVERHFDPSPSYVINPFVRKKSGRLPLDFNDIPRSVFRLKENHNDKYELLIDAFMKLFPNIIDVKVNEFDIIRGESIKLSSDAPYKISDKVYSLTVQDKNLNQPLDFSSLSDGAKRVFLMLAFVVASSIENITLIALEEPENSIHPSLLQGYLRILTQLAGDCRIIVSSHSPYIIEYVPTKDIYIGKPNLSGLADFHRINSKKISCLENDASDAGDSIGSYIFELLSGGEDEIEILNTYLEK